MLPAIPFNYCVGNFYRAAEKGLEADLIWPSRQQNEPVYLPAATILEKLLPALPEQLSGMGFLEADVLPMLAIAEERLATRQTGSRWQLSKLAEYRKQLPKREALVAMVQDYQRNSEDNRPVAQWR